ncbi:MAG TPA: glycosyltransferase [bacterium]|nr:glycosyltransferase [bacterium]HPQ65572.1 glycosyltransferase [bacterium]
MRTNRPDRPPLKASAAPGLFPADVLAVNAMDDGYGSTHRFRHLRRALLRAGFKVAYVESNYRGDDPGVISVAQDPSPAGLVRASWKRMRIVLRGGYRVLLLQTFTPLTVPLLVAAKLRGKAVAVDWDDLGYPLQAGRLRSVLVWMCERVFPRFADCVTTPSRHIREWSERRGLGSPALVPHGIDRELFRPRPPDPELRARLGLGSGPVLVFLASFTTGGVLDIDLILGAAGEVMKRRHDANLLVIGGGPLFAECRARMEAPGLERCVTTGLLPQEEIPSYLALADVALVLMRDNLANRMKTSLKVGEYLAMGKPVVGAVVGETADIFSPYLHACPPTVPGLAGKIMEILSGTPPPRREFDPEAYSWERSGRLLTGALEKKLGLKGRGGE